MHAVQPIAVKPSTHFETISAVAIASNLMFAEADKSAEPWKGWLGGAYTKSVRSIRRPAEALHLQAMEGPRTEFAVGGATAYAFPLMDYAAFPKPLKKLQVTGLDVPRSENTFAVPGAVQPIAVIRSDITMSTGKTAAQVAHGLMLWLMNQDQATVHQ